MNDRKVLKWARRWAKAERALRAINDRDETRNRMFDFPEAVTSEERRAVGARCDYTEQRLLEAVEEK